MIKFIFSLLIAFILGTHSWSFENDSSAVVLEIKVFNRNQLDSIVLYDKEKGWSILSCFRFNSSNSIVDTILISEAKRYSLFSFKGGNQNELGQIMLSPGAKVSFEIEETKKFHYPKYSGYDADFNNLLSFIKHQENLLTDTIRSLIKQNKLVEIIGTKRASIEDEAKKRNVASNLMNKLLAEFDSFSEILLIKNEKYSYKKSLIGKVGNQFVIKDSASQNVQLNSFENKILYIDVWATWCKPCIAEAPMLEKLVEHFGENNEIEILSISIDKDFDRWLKYLRKNHLKGYQFHTSNNSDFVKFYDVGALPRYILIDKSGLVIDADAIRPSNAELTHYIESIMKRK